MLEGERQKLLTIGGTILHQAREALLSFHRALPSYKQALPWVFLFRFGLQRLSAVPNFLTQHPKHWNHHETNMHTIKISNTLSVRSEVDVLTTF